MATVGRRPVSGIAKDILDDWGVKAEDSGAASYLRMLILWDTWEVGSPMKTSERLTSWVDLALHGMRSYRTVCSRVLRKELQGYLLGKGWYCFQPNDYNPKPPRELPKNQKGKRE